MIKPCVVVERAHSLLQLSKLPPQLLAWVVVQPSLPPVHAEVEMLIFSMLTFTPHLVIRRVRICLSEISD